MNGLLGMVLSGSVTMHGVLLEIVLSAGLLVILGMCIWVMAYVTWDSISPWSRWRNWGRKQ